MGYGFVKGLLFAWFNKNYDSMYKYILFIQYTICY